MTDELVKAADLVTRVRALAEPRPPRVAPRVPGLADRGPLAELPELAHLNRSWIIEPVGTADPEGDAAAAGGRGFRSRVRDTIRRIVQRKLAGLLSPYLLQEREFFANLVRLQNEISRRQAAVEAHLRALTPSIEAVAEDLRVDLRELREEMRLLHEMLEHRVQSLEYRQKPLP